jgi:hypothetical protein
MKRATVPSLKEFEMKYRDVEYTVVQGIQRQPWKWSFSIDESIRTGQATTKAEAVKGASARSTARWLLKS